MNAIVAVDQNWAIGNEGRLLFSIPEDMEFFREKTSNKVVVMGRTTLESFPNGRPLKNRVNIVLSRRMDYAPEGVITVHDLEGLRRELAPYKESDIFVIGGGMVYRLLLDWCDRVYVTHIETAARAADTSFPKLTGLGFHLTEESERKQSGDLYYRFCVYERGQEAQNAVPR